ncbi:MAG: hypothetical protein J2P26_12805 [Nocardiopsaceae bacterium]|nr:hypothetical protein [Nocardiopsaceae bacterium]
MTGASDAPAWGPAEGALTITVDGRPWRLRAVSGAHLAGLAATGNWWGLVPGLLDGVSTQACAARLADRWDRLNLRGLYRIACGVAEELYGVPWIVAVRLCATAQAQWTGFGVWCVRHGVDPQRVAAHRVVAACLGWIRDVTPEEKDWTRLEARLWAPDPAADPDEPVSWGAPAFAGTGMDEGELFARALAESAGAESGGSDGFARGAGGD